MAADCPGADLDDWEVGAGAPSIAMGNAPLNRHPDSGLGR